MKRSSIFWGAGLLLVIAASLGYCPARTMQLNAAFATVVEGDTETTVVAKMGRPHRVLEGCGYLGRPVAGCREYVYFPPWSPVGEAWAIRFDAKGTVTSTAHFVSP